MSVIIPQSLLKVVKTFNDLGVSLYGVSCTLYIPTNLTTLEPYDMYQKPDDVTYKEYLNQSVWVEWSGKNINRLRKRGLFAENETPIICRFKNLPEVTIGSYFIVDIKYLNDTYKTDSFEVIDELTSNLYDTEIYRWYKIAPFRKKT